MNSTRARRETCDADPIMRSDLAFFKCLFAARISFFISLSSGHAPLPHDQPSSASLSSMLAPTAMINATCAHCLATTFAHLPHPPHGLSCVQRKHAFVRLET